MPRPPEPRLPDVFDRQTAFRHGYTRSQVETRAANGRWTVLRRGVFCSTSTWDASDDARRHVLRAWAAVLGVDGPAWVSHASAAALRGLPLPMRDDCTWLTRLPPASTLNVPGLTVEVATLPLGDQRTVTGLPTTSWRRTVADCLRHCDPVDALAIADAAARRRPGIESAVAQVIEECGTWPYVAWAARLLPLVDGRHESPLESWSAWEMTVAGLPVPEPQVNLCDAVGTLLGRGDFWWDEAGVLGEADGRSKYAVVDGLDPQKASEVLYREKLREDAIRRTGAVVVRWGARDLARPAAWARRLATELDRRSTFTGIAVPTSRADPAGRQEQARGA